MTPSLLTLYVRSTTLSKNSKSLQRVGTSLIYPRWKNISKYTNKKSLNKNWQNYTDTYGKSKENTEQNLTPEKNTIKLQDYGKLCTKPTKHTQLHIKTFIFNLLILKLLNTILFLNFYVSFYGFGCVNVCKFKYAFMSIWLFACGYFLEFWKIFTKRFQKPLLF